jgi:hypothetical protein
MIGPHQGFHILETPITSHRGWIIPLWLTLRVFRNSTTITNVVYDSRYAFTTTLVRSSMPAISVSAEATHPSARHIPLELVDHFNLYEQDLTTSQRSILGVRRARVVTILSLTALQVAYDNRIEQMAKSHQAEW